MPPLTPDGDEARRWAERELADPVYAAAEPTPLDRIAQAIADFFESLFSTQLSGDWGPWVAVVAAIVVVLVIVAAFLIWGVPRATGRSRPSATLFGADEQRSAAELRRDAASSAAKGEWDAAIVLRFRALARGLVERGAVDTPPGRDRARVRARGGARVPRRMPTRSSRPPRPSTTSATCAGPEPRSSTGASPRSTRRVSAARPVLSELAGATS